MSKEFDYNKALEAIQSGQAITGKDGVLAPLIKQLTEAALTAELEAHLSEETEPNRKNGKSSKTLKTSAGNIRLARCDSLQSQRPRALRQQGHLYRTGFENGRKKKKSWACIYQSQSAPTSGCRCSQISSIAVLRIS